MFGVPKTGKSEIFFFVHSRSLLVFLVFRRLVNFHRLVAPRTVKARTKARARTRKTRARVKTRARKKTRLLFEFTGVNG